MWAIVFPPILNSILGFEEEELKDGYHWLTTEFYSERYLILIVLPFNSLWKQQGSYESNSQD